MPPKAEDALWTGSKSEPTTLWLGAWGTQLGVKSPKSQSLHFISQLLAGAAIFRLLDSLGESKSEPILLELYKGNTLHLPAF